MPRRGNSFGRNKRKGSGTYDKNGKSNAENNSSSNKNSKQTPNRDEGSFVTKYFLLILFGFATLSMFVNNGYADKVHLQEQSNAVVARLKKFGVSSSSNRSQLRGQDTHTPPLEDDTNIDNNNNNNGDNDNDDDKKIVDDDTDRAGNDDGKDDDVEVEGDNEKERDGEGHDKDDDEEEKKEHKEGEVDDDDDDQFKGNEIVAGDHFDDDDGGGGDAGGLKAKGIVENGSEKAQKQNDEAVQTKSKDEEAEKSLSNANDAHAAHKIANLSCEAYGGPSNKDAEEMVYWEDIPRDALHMSPFHMDHPEYKPQHQTGADANSENDHANANKVQKITQFLTFEPDEGGWNNIRMAMGA